MKPFMQLTFRKFGMQSRLGPQIPKVLSFSSICGAPARRWMRIAQMTAICVAVLLASGNAALSSAVRHDDTMQVGEGGQSIPVSQWRDASTSPRAIVLAIHGLTLHGGAFDQVARELATRGIVTVAPDLRGFGRCYKNGGDVTQLSSIDYEASKNDLLGLCRRLRSDNPGVPVYCVGESMGASLAVWMSGTHPELLDGVVLASPCINRFWHLRSRMIIDACKGLSKTTRQLSMKPYFEHFLSHDPQVTIEYERDPLVRKTLCARELWHCGFTSRNALREARNIPPDMPVLVVEGTDDRLYKPSSVPKYMAMIRSTDQRTYWAKDCGHLLLETTLAKPFIINTIADWINDHAANKRSVAVSGMRGAREMERPNN